MTDFTKDEILEIMNCIDPASLSYNDWFRVVASFKSMGADAEMVEQWSRSDPRFKSNDIRKRWNGITDTGRAGPGTAIYLARQNGYNGRHKGLRDRTTSYSPTQKRQEEAPEDPVRTIEWLPTVPGSFADFQAELLGGMPHADQRRAFLEELFDPGDYINFVVEAVQDGSKYAPLPSQKKVCTRDEWLSSKLITTEDYNHEAGMWVRINPIIPDPKGSKAVCDDDVASFKYTLIESDEIPESDQIEAYRRLNLPVAALVLSGGKSVHAVVRVDARDRAEYDERVKVVHDWCKRYGVSIDPANKNPSRMMRFPGVTRGQREQKLIGLQSGAKSWADFEYFVEGQKIGLPPLLSVEDITGPNLLELPAEVIEGTLRLRDVMMISGSSKSGKSFLLIELALAIASGRTWLGRRCNQGAVLYLNMEIPDGGFSHRLENVRNAMDISLEEVRNNLFVLNLRGSGADLDQAKKAIIHYGKQHHFSLIILDPLYKLLGGRDENSAGDVGTLFDEFDQIAEASGAAVLFCHHHSKGGQAGKVSMDRASGSGVFARAPDCILDCLELEVSNEILATLDFDSIPFGIQYEWTVRGYAPREPEQGFFIYPVHVPDREGILRGARTAREAKASDTRKRNANKTVHWQTVCDTVYQKLLGTSKNGMVSADEMVEAVMGVADTRSEDFVTKKMRNCGYKIERGKPSKGIPRTVIIDDEGPSESTTPPPLEEEEFDFEQLDLKS